MVSNPACDDAIPSAIITPSSTPPPLPSIEQFLTDFIGTPHNYTGLPRSAAVDLPTTTPGLAVEETGVEARPGGADGGMLRENRKGTTAVDGAHAQGGKRAGHHLSDDVLQQAEVSCGTTSAWTPPLCYGSARIYMCQMLMGKDGMGSTASTSICSVRLPGQPGQPSACGDYA